MTTAEQRPVEVSRESGRNFRRKIIASSLAAVLTVGAFVGYSSHKGRGEQPTVTSTEKGGRGGGMAGEPITSQEKDLRLRVLKNQAVRTIMADILGMQESDITPEIAVLGPLKDNEGHGSVSWFSPDKTLRVGIAYGQRRVGGLDNLTFTQNLAQSQPNDYEKLDIADADGAFYMKSGSTAAFLPNVVITVGFNARDSKLPKTAEGGYTAPGPDARAATADIARLLVLQEQGRS